MDIILLTAFELQILLGVVLCGFRGKHPLLTIEALLTRPALNLTAEARAREGERTP